MTASFLVPSTFESTKQITENPFDASTAYNLLASLMEEVNSRTASNRHYPLTRKHHSIPNLEQRTNLKKKRTHLMKKMKIKSLSVSPNSQNPVESGVMN